MALNNLKLFELFRKSTTPKFFTEDALEELDSLYGNIERSEIIKNNSDDATISDGSMFMASVVPLRLKSDVSLHWKNPRPSSVHYCRPIMFQFARESAELIRTTVKDIEEQISKIKPTKLQIGEGKYI